MMTRKHIFVIFTILFFAVNLIAQKDVWPVQISGSMTPPHSLNLQVYGFERTEDLSFQLLLKDPVEANLLVRPVITIEQNGNIIYQTDPNFGGDPILLSQFEQMMINGSVLQKYLSNTALIGAKVNSTGSVEVPEGFNQICLQLYGVDRDVPVSNKFCISGNFRLNQPPQIVKPAFNEKIKMPLVQNMIFSWQAMHLGSGNNPGPVEYTFELVELPMGVMNANDAFESSLRIYNTKTTATSLIYSPAEPKLDPDKYYAWRVTATSIMYPTSKLFQNDGKSEVSMFVLYDGDAPTSEINPFDNSSPRGCSVYETAYGPVTKADNEPMIAAPNQSVKLGYFNMKITEVSGNQQVGFSGKGLVEYPMLRSILEVDFKNIQINKEGRVYQSERISAVIDPALAIDVNYVSKDKLEKIITTSYLYLLNTELKKPNKIVAKLSDGSGKRNVLPLELRSGDAAPGVSVIGIEFTPTNAFISFISQGNEGGIYAATLIPSTPYGIKSNAHLTALNVAGYERVPIKLLESIETGAVLSDNSKMNCNCKGFESLKEESQLSISTNILTRADNQAPVTFAPVKKLTTYQDALINVEKIPDFKVKGLNDLTFKAKNGVLDLNNSSNNFDGVSNDYTSGVKTNWKGLRLYDVETTLPEKYNIINSKSILTLDKGEIYIDENELAYGQLYKTNVLDISKGKMGPWNYSIDTMKVTMQGRQFGKFQLNGKIKTPFFDDQFPYNAIVSEGYSQQIQLDAVIPNTKLGMSIWHGNFVSKTPSKIDAKLVQTDNSKLLTPKCSFNGELAIKFNDQEFRNSILNANKGETIDALRKALKIETLDFDLSGLNVAGLSCDPFKEKNKRYKADDFDTKNAKLMFGNAPNKISDGALVYVTEDQRERLGLKTFIIKDNSKVEITIWSESKEGVLTFEGVEVNSIDLKCNCGVADVTPSPRAWDKIIEEFYDKNYSISYSGSASGGTMSFNPMIQSAFLKSVTMEEIKRRAIAWFPSLDENSINIPFLDRNLNIEKSGGSYSGKFKNGRTIDKNTVWTKEIFDGLVNEQAGNLNLPLIITEELWSKFGFKGNYALPENYKLFISEFKAAKNDNLSNATIKVGLVGALNVDGKDVFIQFGSNENLPIGPDKVAFNDVYLHLLKDAKLDEKVTYLSSDDFDKTSESGSYVKLNCTEGVNNFNLQGNVIVKENTIVNSAFQPAVFGFKLIESKIDGNDELLSQFIAPLKTGFKEQNDWKAWSFTTDDDHHIKFSAGNSFEAYLDYSSKDVVSITEDALFELDDFTQIRLSSEYYKGIIFNKMEFQIPLLEQKRDEKGGNPETFKDNVFMSYFEFESNSYFSNYEGINKVPQENNAKLGGWQYHLDTVSYNIAYNSLDEDKLALKGGTRMPLFREAPVKDKDKWLETYSDAWVSYALNVEYNKKDNYPEISGVVDGIEESLFESKHINGLGLKLDAESSVDFNYNNDQGRLIARANLSGRSIYYIEKLDAKIPLLKFQDFNVNYSTSGMCKSNGADGIESIDFGTWSIVDFSEADKAAFAKASTMLAATEKGKSVNTKVKENKFVKGLGNKLDGLSKLASFDVNIHEPSFTCTGDNWKFILGLDLSIMRDKSNLTETQQAAYDKYNPLETATTKQAKAESELKPVADAYKEAQKNIKTIADERTVLVKEKQRLQTELKTFKKDKSIKVNGKDVGYNSASNTKEIETRNNDIAALDKKIADSNTKYKTAIASVKEKYAPFKEQNSKIKEATNEVDKLTKAAVEKQDKYNKSGVKDRLTQDKATFKEKLAEAKETKTGAFSASGDIEVTFNSQGFKDVGLTCLALGGEFGPIKFDGGINLFRDETTKPNFDPNATQSAWGNGFLGMIRLRVLEYEFATKFQTGVKLDKAAQSTTVDDFRYWFADLAFNSAAGIPLGQTSFNLTGLGGGFYYNMAREISGLVKKDEVALPPANNDNCKADGMKAGESLSGFQYKVSRGSMGGYLSAEISHTAKISVEGILSLEIAVIDGSFKFKNFGFNLNGYLFYEDYFARKTESTAVVKGEINLNFEENFKVLGGIDFRFGKKAGPLTIEAPEGKTADANKWNSIKFLFSKDINYVHAGSWGIPGNSGTRPASGLNFLSAGFEAPLFGKVTAGLYAQIGNNTDGLPSIQYLLPDYNGAVKSLKNSSVSKGFAANAGFKLNAEFGNEFLIFKWSAKANIGANLAIENMGKGVTCGGVTEKVGFENGYYLRGNAFAMLDADASIDVPIWGDVSIFDARVGIILDFGFPNPSYLDGDFLVEYSVLGGKFEGKQYMKINLGNKPCGAFEPNPIVGIKVFKSTFPENGATNIKSLNEIQNNTSVMINQKYLISQESNKKVIIKCILEKYEVTDKITKKIIKTESSPGVGLNGSGIANNYHGQVFNETLKSNTTYQINITYKWLRITSIDGQADREEILSEEKVESYFTTGLPEDVITQDMITSQFPGYRQRYWTKGYEKACIKFKEEVNQDQITKLFPEEVGYKRQIYFAVIKENKKDGSVVYHRTPVINFPNNYKWKSTFTTDKTLLIPGLDSMGFDKGSFCTMTIFRAVDNLGDYEKLAKLEAKSSDENLSKETPEQKIIYTTHFAVSEYKSIYDKLKDVKVSAAIGNSSIASSKRNLLMSRTQVQEIVDMDIETLEVIPKNVYYGIKGIKEGIDSFDFNKIIDNVSFGFSESVNYYNWTRKYYFDKIILCINNFTADPDALVNSNRNKVLDKFTVNLRRKDDDFSPTASGNEFTIFSPGVQGNKYELTGEEIASGKLNIEKVNYSMGDGPFVFSENYADNKWNPDFILEDGIASTAALQYLFTKISILKVLGNQNSAIEDGEGLNVSKYYGTGKYFTINDSDNTSDDTSPKKYFLEKYYSGVSTLIFADPDSFNISIINIKPETVLFKNTGK